MKNPRKTSSLFFLGGLILVGALLRFCLLTNQSMWFDEIYVANSVGGFSWDSLKHLWLNDIHPPLYTLILNGWSALFGDSDWALRALSALVGVVSLTIFYFLVKLLTNNETAIYSLALFAISPLALYYSQEVRHYNLWMLWSLLSFLFFFQILYEGKRRQEFWLLFTCLAFYTHIYSAFILFIQGWIYFFERKGDRYQKRFWLPLAVLLLLLLPLIWWGFLHLDNQGGHPKHFQWAQFAYLPFAWTLRYAYGPSVNDLHIFSPYEVSTDWLWPSLLGFTIITPLLITGLYHGWKNKRTRPLILPLILANGIIVLSPLFSNISFNVRATLFAFPFYLLFLGMGCSRFMKLQSRPIKSFPIALIALMLFADYNYFHNPYYYRDDLRRAAKILETNPKIPIVASPMSNFFAMQHYSKIPQQNYYAFTQLRDLAQKDELWLIWNRMWIYPESDRYTQWINSEYKVVEEHELPGIKLQRVVKN